MSANEKHVLAFAFTRLEVADLDVSERFYCDVLGFHLVRRVQAAHTDYRLEEVILSLGAAEHSTSLILTHFEHRDAAPSGAGWIGLMVTDIENIADEIAAAGGRIIVPVHGTPAQGVKSVHAGDPDGHMIALIEIMRD